MTKKFIYDIAGVLYEAEAFEKSEYIVVSSGSRDAGRPIVLNSKGLVDSSMIDSGRAKDVDIDELEITTPNVKVAYTLVDGLKKLIIRNKSMAETRFNFDNGSKNFSIPKGSCFELNDLNFQGKIIYIEADKASTIEIMQLY